VATRLVAKIYRPIFFNADPLKLATPPQRPDACHAALAALGRAHAASRMSCAAERDPLVAARRLRDIGGQADAALAYYDRALALTPNARTSAGLYFELAALAHANGRVAVLERSLRASVRLLPAFGDGHFELGNTLHSQNRYAEAVESFEMALRQEQLGDRGMVYNNLANALTEVGHEQRAERAYAQGLRLVPRGSTAAYLLNGLANQQSARGRDERVAFRGAGHAAR